MNHPRENNEAIRCVAVAGASGYIGRHVVRELQQQGYTVVALVRACSQARCEHDAFFEGVLIRTCDVTDPRSIAHALYQSPVPDALVSCIAARDGSPEQAQRVDFQANHDLLGAARHLGMSQFILLSAICVQRPVLAFQRAKLAFEAELRASELTWSIVRPTAFFKSLAGQVERIKTGRPFLLFGMRGYGPACVPISERDTAAFMVDCLRKPAYADRILPIGGPGPAITPYERGLLLFTLAGRQPRFRRLPIALFDSLIPLMAAGGRFSTRLNSAAEFARIGRFYATEPMLLRTADGRYNAWATPRYGHDTLDAFYHHVWHHGMAGQELGEQALF